MQSNAPPLVITAHNETVREGDTVVLTCTSNGLNTQNIAWLKDSTPLDPSVYSIVDNTLTIDSADVSTHSGDYQCIKDQLYSNIFTLTVKSELRVYVVYLYTCMYICMCIYYIFLYVYSFPCESSVY